MNYRSTLQLLLLLAPAIFLTGCPSCSRGVIDEGDAFVVLMDSSPRGLDPRFATTHSSAQLAGLIYEGLLTQDTRDGAIEFRLASSVEQIDPVTYEILLRDDAFFHDGVQVTAKDVEYTYMELGSEEVKSPLAGRTARIKEFKVLDDFRIRITLKEPYAPFLGELSLGIVPAHLCAGRSECEEIVGAGAFRFISQSGDLRFELRRFDDYFGGAPPIDRLVFRVLRDDNARLLALLGNTADLVQNAVSPLMLPVVERSDRLQVDIAPSFKYTYLAFNLEHPVLSDQKVREAIAHAIDRESIIKYKFAGTARLSTGMLPPDHWAYEENVETFSFDPDRARAILDEAGYPVRDDGYRFEIEFKISANKFRRSLAELIGQQLGEVGINVRVRSYEWGTFFDDIRSRNFHITTLQWPAVNEPALYRWIFHSENIPTPENRAAGANRGAYSNPEVDALIEAGERETDPEKRREIYSEVQKILARELPYVSLWHEDNITVVRKGTKGYYTTPGARYDSLRTTIPAPR